MDVPRTYTLQGAGPGRGRKKVCRILIVWSVSTLLLEGTCLFLHSLIFRAQKRSDDDDDDDEEEEEDDEFLESDDDAPRRKAPLVS